MACLFSARKEASHIRKRNHNALQSDRLSPHEQANEEISVTCCGGKTESENGDSPLKRIRGSLKRDFGPLCVEKQIERDR